MVFWTTWKEICFYNQEYEMSANKVRDSLIFVLFNILTVMFPNFLNFIFNIYFWLIYIQQLLVFCYLFEIKDVFLIWLDGNSGVQCCFSPTSPKCFTFFFFFNRSQWLRHLKSLCRSVDWFQYYWWWNFHSLFVGVYYDVHICVYIIYIYLYIYIMCIFFHIHNT